MRVVIVTTMLCLGTIGGVMPAAGYDRHDYRGWGQRAVPDYTVRTHRLGRRAVRKHRTARHRSSRRTRQVRIATPAPRTLAGYRRHGERGSSVALSAVIGPLAAKVRAIMAACGSRVTSGYRPGARINGSGRPSLHASYPARAVDLVGNPSCIRRQLAGWPGGMSTDYGAVAHYHVSYDPGGREWGVRFAHRTGRTRYAKFARRRYARAY